MKADIEKQTFNRVAEDYGDLVENAMSIKSGHDYYEEYKVMNLKAVMDKVRKKDEPLRILDYGCGVGLLDRAIDRKEKNVVINGFDVSDESVKKAEASFEGKGYIFTSKLEDLSDGYDMAILSVVLHHVSLDERPGVMDNIFSRLRKGGILVIIEHNMFNPLTKKTVDSCEFDKDAVMLNRKTAEGLMEKAGFTDIKSRFITFFPEKLKFLWRMEKYLGWFPAGAQFMTEGYKS